MFNTHVVDAGAQLIAMIMIGLSIATVALSLPDRSLHTPDTHTRKQLIIMPANPLGALLRN